MARRLEVTIIGDAASLEKALGKAGSAVDGLEGKTAKGHGTLAKFGAVAAGAFAGGVGLATAAVGESVKAAQHAEVAEAKLKTQVEAVGISYEKHAGQIDTVIQKTSALTGFTGVDLQGAFTSIIRTTGSVSKSTKDLALATDLARGKNIDLATAATIVGKVAGGNTGILSRYGITIQKGATATEALGLLHEKFKGQAKAYGDTAAGAQDKFKASVEHLQEAVGKGLLPVLTSLFSTLSDGLQWLQKHHTAAIALTVVFGSLVGGLTAAAIVEKTVAASTALLTAGQWLAAASSGALAAATGALSTVFWTLDAAMDANPIGLVVIGLAALGAALVLAYEKSRAFRDIVNGAFGAIRSVVSAVMPAIEGVLSAAWDAIKTVAKIAWDAIKLEILTPIRAARDVVGTVADAIGSVLSGAWGAIKGATTAAWEFVSSHILGPVRDARDSIGDVVTGIVNRVGSAWGTVKGVISDIAGGIEHALTAPFSAAWGTISGVVGQIKSAVDSITSLPGKALSAVGLAQGGTVHRAIGGGGGVIARVGELGPETVFLPGGSRVVQASQSTGAVGQGGIVMHFSGPVGSSRAARVMADQLAYRLRFGG